MALSYEFDVVCTRYCILAKGIKIAVFIYGSTDSPFLSIKKEKKIMYVCLKIIILRRTVTTTEHETWHCLFQALWLMYTGTWLAVLPSSKCITDYSLAEYRRI